MRQAWITSHEIYKRGGKLLIKKPYSLIKMIWIEEKVPAEWKTNGTIPKHNNKGDKLQYRNYRGMSLRTRYKTLTAVHNNTRFRVGK
jgi:hypothetical protein